MGGATRREVLQAAGVLGVTGGLALATEATPAFAAAKSRPGRDFVTASQDLHLLRRATYGPTPDSLQTLRRLGTSTWLDQQLTPSLIDDSKCQQMIHQKFPQLSWTIPQAWSRLSPGEHWTFMIDIGLATIARAIWSKRQLFEVMCDFWANHLNVTSPSTTLWFARHAYDRDVVRKNALGRFEDMLIASARNPSMLMYLNNAESTKFEPNENYGRELLELHTVGIDGGYNETDMYNSALIMTGFTVNENTGTYKYDTSIHHTGAVTVMGFSRANASAANGETVGIDYLKYLANHPSTARHIAAKLCRRFVNDDPDDAFVDELAQVYQYNGTDITPVLRHLFESQEFAASVGEKLRRPMEDVVATARILNYGPEPKGTEGLRSLYWMCNEIGHAPFAWGLPDGYPDDATSWLSAGATLNRWNRHYSMAGHWAAHSLRLPPLRNLLPQKLPRTWGAMLDDLAKRLVFRTIEPHHKQIILNFMDRAASDRFDSGDTSTYKLAQCSALILDTPYHGVR